MKAFSLKDTLESGQIFRFNITEEGAYVAHADKVFFIEHNNVPEEYKHFFREDQPELTHRHPYVQEALENTQGIRVIRQDEWECLCAFILSQNNHQKRIQKNVLDLSTFGKELEHRFYSFPQPHELPDEDTLRELGFGYRAAHIAALKDIDLDWLYNLKNLEYEQAKKQLQTLRGVGPKVADCILLFSMGFDQACPEDTWIKKIFSENNLNRQQLGDQAGLYQQMLFHYARSVRE
jgi:N-glycosylase/DNA lyase